MQNLWVATWVRAYDKQKRVVNYIYAQKKCQPQDIVVEAEKDGFGKEWKTGEKVIKSRLHPALKKK